MLRIRHLIFIVFIFGFVCELSSADGSEKTAIILSDQAVSEDANDDVTVEENTFSQERLSENVFVPTKEWQPINPGQAIPRGLHVRMNLETGEREAKLMDQQESHSKKYTGNTEIKKGMMNTDGPKSFTRSQLKEALKKIEKDEPETLETDESISKKFRSYEELKKDLGDLRLQMKTDQEVITDLLREYKQSNTTIDRKLTILKDFEYLVHQIDNAQSFVDMGGFTILSGLLNGTDPRLKEWAAFVIGSASQSNPKVKIAALEHGILHQLIRIFQLEDASAIRRKCLFAFSSILRNFPFSQKKFLELGGLEVLRIALQENTGDENQKLKIITLVSDLLNERREIEYRMASHSSPSPIQHQKELLTKVKQYREAPLTEALVEGGWCQSVGDLLATPNLDGQEKVIQTMHVMREDCRTNFHRYMGRLRKLEDTYRSQLDDDDDNEYMKYLLTLINSLISGVNAGERDEL